MGLFDIAKNDDDDDDDDDDDNNNTNDKKSESMGLFSFLKSSSSEPQEDKKYNITVRAEFRAGEVEDKKVKGIHLDFDTYHRVMSYPREEAAEQLARHYFPVMHKFHYLFINQA